MQDGKGQAYYTATGRRRTCRARKCDELNKQGTVVRKREAPLTPEQQAAREAEAEAQERGRVQQAQEEKRKNQALLNTYSSEKDIETGGSAR